MVRMAGLLCMLRRRQPGGQLSHRPAGWARHMWLYSGPCRTAAPGEDIEHIGRGCTARHVKGSVVAAAGGRPCSCMPPAGPLHSRAAVAGVGTTRVAPRTGPPPACHQPLCCGMQLAPVLSRPCQLPFRVGSPTAPTRQCVPPAPASRHPDPGGWNPPLRNIAFNLVCTLVVARAP